MNFYSLLQMFLSLALLLGHGKPDQDPLQDYCIADPEPCFYLNGVPCINPEFATAAHFTTSALSKPGDTKANIFGYNSTITTVANLPGINTLGLALSRIDLAPAGIVPPHSHPRASEVTTCFKGSILVGFVDTANKAYTQQLRVGESFVFPKGLIHFVYNTDQKNPALAISGFSSQNPGVQIASIAAFASHPLIPDNVVKRAFQISGQDLMKIRKNLGG